MTTPKTIPSTSPIRPPESVENQRGHHGGAGRYGPAAKPSPAFSGTRDDDDQGEAPQGHTRRYIQNSHAAKYALRMVNSIGGCFAP